MPLLRDFAVLGRWDDRLPDESAIFRFRHVLEKHSLAEHILTTVNLLFGAKDDVRWHVAIRPGLRKLLDQTDPMDALTEHVERIKASICTKVKHPSRVIKRQFWHVKVRYRSLAKNTAQLQTLFARANLRMSRRRLIGDLP